MVREAALREMPENVGGVGHAVILWAYLKWYACQTSLRNLSDGRRTDISVLTMVMWLRHGSFLCIGELCLNFLAQISGQIRIYTVYIGLESLNKIKSVHCTCVKSSDNIQ